MSANPLTFLWHRWVLRHQQSFVRETESSWVGKPQTWCDVTCSCGKGWVLP
jgi:hypothetical protein